MRSPRGRPHAPTLAALAALGLLVACNALNGAGDLTFACDGCEALEGGATDGATSGADGSADALVSADGPSDGPGADTSKEGPGGILDPTFGNNGIFFLGTSPVDPRALAVRTDGRIVVAGSFSGDLAAVAFTPAGATDTTFGTAGRIVRGSGNSSAGNAVAFDSQGRAVVAGISLVINVSTGLSTRYSYIVRIGTSQVDTTFATSGAFRGPAGEEARAIVVTANDAVVAAVESGNDYRFLRLTPTGALDNAFGASGYATVNDVGGDPRAIAAVADGFVAAGGGNIAGQGQAFGTAKVSLAGQPALLFGTNAIGSTKVGPSSEIGQAIAAQADAKLIVSGDFDPQVNLLKRVTSLVRFTSSGQLDSTYGTAGKTDLDLTESGVGRDTETTSTHLFIDAKGRALAVGNVHDRPVLNGTDRYRAWVARFGTDGKLDPLFGTQGKLVFGTAPARLIVRGAALQPDGKLVIVGVDTNNGNALFLARIITTTTL